MSGDQPSALHPSVLWAQRADCLYVTIPLGDVKDKVLDLKDGSLLFRGKSGTPKPREYEVLIEFHGQVDPESSRQMSTDREIVMYIKKKEKGFWPRLLSSSAKQPWLKVDFNRWVDENDSEPELGGMDNFANMFSDMSRFNDYGSDDADADADADVDSDDEDLPDLEIPTKAGEEKSELNGETKADEGEKEKKAEEATA
ncbi:Prostaglandin e synthase [Fasciola hepatica]|uniref:Prostaglandin e synthase n=1 Tax=Fasciola hepatica TaxID=6192 RepID=A0A2H1BSU2_FASHE|nr:Prostaglandin e synthase [Fasciola hepatica]